MRSLLFLLFAVSVSAQVYPPLQVTGTTSASAVTVASLPSASANNGQLVWVKDGANATDCSTGGGVFVVPCKSNGTSWSALSIGSASGGGATTPNTSLPLCGNGSANATKACTPGTDFQAPKSSVSLGNGYLSNTYSVGTGGVTANTLVQFDSSANAIAATSGYGGIAVTTAAANGTVEVARNGVVGCVFENAATLGNIAIPGTTNKNQCRDSGLTSSTLLPSTTPIIGLIQASGAANSTIAVRLHGVGIFGTQVASGSGLVAVTNGVSRLAVAGTDYQLPIAANTYAPYSVSTYTSSGTGAVARSINNKVADVFSVKDFGAVGNGSTDDTSAIQAALNACNATISANAYAKNVLFPTGLYNVTSTLQMGGCSLISDVPGYGTQIVWGGPAGGVVAVQSTYGSFFSIKGIGFISGANSAGTFLQFNSTLVDLHSSLEGVSFDTCSGNAVEVNGGWVNLDWRKLRFDHIGGYALKLIPYSGQNGAVIHISDFEYDNAATTNSQGFLLVDDSSANSANLGNLSLTNARIEINAPMGGNKSLLTLRNAVASSPNTSILTISLSDLYVQDSASTANDAVVYNDFGSNNNASYPIHIRNVTLENISNFFSASGSQYAYGAVLPLSAGNHIGVVNYDFGVPYTFALSPIEAVGYGSSNIAIQTRPRDSTTPAFTVRTDGFLNWYGVTGITAPSAGVIAIGNGTASDASGTLEVNKIRSNSAANTDLAGSLTLASGTASYSFTGAYTSAPICTATDTSAANAVRIAVTTSSLTISGTGTDQISYLCIGRN